MKARGNRGGVGFIVLLIVALIIGVLVLKNLQGTNATVTLPGSSEAMAPDAVLEKFKADAKHIEDMQKQISPVQELEEK